MPQQLLEKQLCLSPRQSRTGVLSSVLPCAPASWMKEQGSSEEEGDVRQGLHALSISLAAPAQPEFHTHQSRWYVFLHPFSKENLEAQRS